MRNWSKEFNALPKEIRAIGAAMECRTRIQHLKFEKLRLKKHYTQSCEEINEHIRNCEAGLRRLDSPCNATEQRGII